MNRMLDALDALMVRWRHITSPLLRGAVAAALFVPLSVAMTWPLALQAATHIPSDGGDGPMFVWNLWWMKRAVWELRQWPFATNAIFYPEGVDLTFHTLTALHGLISIPLQLLAGPVLAANALFLLSFIVSAAGAWALARYGGATSAAALVAGAVFAFSPYTLAQARGHYNLSSTWLIPVFALCLLRAFDGRSLRWAAAAGAALAAMTLNEYQYGAFGLLFLLAAAPLRQRRWAPGALARTAAIAATVGLTAGTLLAPLLLDAARAVAAGTPVADSQARQAFFSADLTGFLTPPGIRWGGRESGFLYATSAFLGIGGSDGTVYLGAAALLLAAAALLRLPAPAQAATGAAADRPARRRGWLGFWAAVAVIFLVLALGPRLHIFGQETFGGQSWAFSVPLPYATLSEVPVLGSTRVPSRFTIMAMLGLAMLAAAGVDRLRALAAHRAPLRGRCARSLAVPALALALVAADVGAAPIMTQPLAPHPFYQRLAVEPGDFAVLELPFGQVVGPSTAVGRSEAAALLEYYQTVHGKRLLGGYVARERPARIEPVLRRPGLGWLASNGAALRTERDEDVAAVREAFRALDIRYAVVHPALFPDLSGKSFVEEYLVEQLEAREVYRDSDLVAYRIGAGRVAPVLDRDVTNLEPVWGAKVASLTPRLRWTRSDASVTVEQIQVSLDRDFGPRGFLYFETRDAALSDIPHSYVIPAQYPLEPNRRYFWRVRGMAGGQPGPWSAVGSFWTPAEPPHSAAGAQVSAAGGGADSGVPAR